MTDTETAGKIVAAKSANKGDAMARRVESRRAEQSAPGFRERSKLGESRIEFPNAVPAVKRTPTERALEAVKRAFKRHEAETVAERHGAKVDRKVAAEDLRQMADSLERAKQ